MIATNMAGRGVDIKLGGDPEHLAMHALKAKGIGPGDEGYEEALAEKVAELEPSIEAEAEEVRELGGLFICGTERHESRRIDNQLRGRSGRQGDPGETRFFLSAEDDVIRLFAGDRIYKILDKLGPGRRERRGDAAGSENADQNGRERPEEGRGAELPDPQTGARVRRRDERAAPRRLQIPRRDPRRPRHVRRRPRRARGRDRAPRRRVHAGRRARGVGPARARGPAAPDLAGRASTSPRWRRRRSTAKSSRTRSTKTR